MLRKGRLFPLFVCAVVGSGCLVSQALCASGTWTAEAVGPNMYLEGRTYTVKFEPTGNIPDGATITEVSWSWSSFPDQRSDLEVKLGSDVLGTVDISKHGSGITDAFAGENPNQSFFLSFKVPGSGAINPVMYGQRNTVTVNWEDTSPQFTEITGPSEVEVAHTIELDGSVGNATTYLWGTAGACSIPDAAEMATATIRGDRNGSCLVARVACNDLEQCTSDTHNITVTGELVLLPMYHLLLLK